MYCYIGLGSNLENRQSMLAHACFMLAAHKDITLLAQSSLYETPALLPENAPDAWNRPYLNQGIAISTDLSAEQLLQQLKHCEVSLGRRDRERWAPREIDCDLLFYSNEIINTETLTIPHQDMHKRGFVLAPLCELDAEFIHPILMRSIGELWESCADRSITRILPKRPQMMGVLNITPDSFSDGGRYVHIDNACAHLEFMINHGADIIDIGAQSTRPDAMVLTAEEEAERLFPLLDTIKSVFSKRSWQLSIDTYHAQTMQRLLHYDIDIINDVSGMRAKDTIDILKRSTWDIIVMHALTIPPLKHKILKTPPSVEETITMWAKETLSRLGQEGIDAQRIILDPGIGFGKSAEQSFSLIKNASVIKNAVPNARWLYAHSRKSFLEITGASDFSSRDHITAMISQSLAYAGIDMLRVHDVVKHTALFDRLYR